MPGFRKPGWNYLKFLLLIVSILLVYAAGCTGDPVQKHKDRFNLLIDRLEHIPMKDGRISDFGMFYRDCEDILNEYRDSEYAVDRLKDLLLTSGSVPVRGGAALLLGQMGSIQDLLPLIEALKDEEPFVRGKALKALKEITHEEIGPEPDRWKEWWNSKEKTDGK